MSKAKLTIALGVALAIVALTALPVLADFQQKGSFKKDKYMELSFGVPVDEAWAKDPNNYTVYEKKDPDIRIPVKAVELGPKRVIATLEFEAPLNQTESSEYIVEVKNVMSGGKPLGSGIFKVRKSQFSVLVGIIITNMLIQNFVFTKYLGLCIFFGVSQRKETAVGMGITFTIVMVLTAIFCWALYSYLLNPYHLDFLKIIVFIGTTAIFVQAVDTILRKINPYLFKKLGVYLVLIVTNCIILAVPLLNADRDYNLFQSTALGLGAGVGFAIALFLMACVREKLEVCRVPPTFTGLPIAFVVAGLFALAFLGFSGLSIF